MKDDKKTTTQIIEDLRAQRDDLQSRMDGLAATGIRVDVVGADYRIISQNKPLQDTFGDHAGKLCFECYMGLDKPCDPCPMTAAINSGSLESAEMTGRDGRRYEIFSAPLPSRDGIVDMAIEVVQDITERKQAEDMLLESEERYRILGENVRDVVFIQDMNLNITYTSPSVKSLFGYSVEEVLNLKMEKLMTPESLERAYRSFQEYAALREKGDVDIPLMEYEYIRKDGSTFWGELHVNFLHDANGLPVGSQGILRNITERRQAEEDRLELQAQLQQAQKLESLGVLASGIAHDFNNLLVGIYGNMDLALLKVDEGSPILRYIANAKTAARRAADLIGQMLAYAGRGDTNPTEIQLGDLVQEMAGLLLTSVSKKTAITLDMAEDLLPMRGDPTQIRQIVMNLITNSAQAIGEETGDITLKTEMVECDRAFLTEIQPDTELPEGTYLLLRISDNGPGMDEETQKQIFDPFFTTKATGSGLGLSAVHGIVHSHGGAIRIESAPGKGTSFTILFPASLQSTGASEACLTSSEWHGTGTILVVDDEEVVRSVAAEMLKLSGFSVLTAAGGNEAIDLFLNRHNEIDCVLLDWKMPHMGAEETYDEIRKFSDVVPVILSSGHSEQESVQRFDDRALAGFIQKPYEATSLIEKLREVLGDKFK